MSGVPGALVRACHPVPVLGVTVFATYLAIVAGNDVGTCALVAAAILSGQLTVGWTNDRHDQSADHSVGRASKPLATGELSARTVDVAITISSVATIALSLSLGWRAGLIHLAAVAVAWAYNFGVKGTWFSWLPYALAFGSLPAIATLALPDHQRPGWWALAAGACLGVAANFANAIGDIADDRATGMRGAPARVGQLGSLVVTAAFAVVSCLLIAVGPSGAAGPFVTVCASVAVLLVLAGAVLLRTRAGTRVPFYALMCFVPIDLIMLGDIGRLH